MSRAEGPIIGIVGVVGGSDGEVARQLTGLEQHPPPGLGGLEVRADLLSASAAALEVIDRVKSRWPVIFTVRRRDLKSSGAKYYRRRRTSARTLAPVPWSRAALCAKIVGPSGPMAPFADKFHSP